MGATFFEDRMKTTHIVAIILVAIVACAGAYLILVKSGGETGGPSSSAPEGFSVVSQTTQGSNTVTTYSGTGTTQSAYSAFDAWMAGNGWELKMENGIFAGYQGHLYDKGNETAVVQVTSQAGQITVILVRGSRPSGPQENQPPSENQPSGGTTLENDFQPWSGRGRTQTFPATQRLLLATSDDGLNFTRKNVILSDCATVPDAVVLNNGRVLVYYVAESIIENGIEISSYNKIVVAVSDDNGNTWSYKKVKFNGVPSGATDPVDPNVVLMPDGSLRLFTTIDPAGPQLAHTYSFVSTDNGFTYTLEGERFSVSGQVVLDPEVFRFSDSNWQIWAGTRHAISSDGNTFTDQGIVNLGGEQYPRVIADVTDFSTTTPLYRMYTHSGNPQGGTDIKSLTSTDSNNWVLEGTRLTLDTSTGLESDILFFPTVVRLKNGKYLMVYETTIPR
jgi:hypothetical protein